MSTASGDPKEKGVLALQAFLSPEDEAQLVPLCLEVLDIEGFDSDLRRNGRLHLTLATWQVTPAEAAQVHAEFASPLRDLPAITVPASLAEERGNGGLACALLPEPSEALLQWHAQVHARAAWPFTPWREIDQPGSWWPHMGLCHVRESKEPIAAEPLRKLRDVKQVTLARIGLVSYLGPMHILEEVALRRTAADPASYLAEVKAELRKQWPDRRSITIVCHGHSVPAGFFDPPTIDSPYAYPHLLFLKLKECYPTAPINVIVTAVGGEDSATGAARFAEDVLSLRPDVVTLDYALNDRRISPKAASAAWKG